MRLVYVAALLVGVCACRAVVGIEDQTIGTADGGAPAADAATDAAQPRLDAASDAPVTSLPGYDPACAAQKGGASPGPCLKCCRDKVPNANPRLDELLRSGCLCGGAGLCTSTCATALCAGGPPGEAGSGCLNCVSESTTRSECGGALASCSTDATCKPVGECIVASCR